MVLSVRASAPRYHKKSKVHLASLPSAERRPRRESSLPQLTSKEILWDLCWTWYEEWEVSGHMRVSNKKSHRRILARVGLPAARVHVDCAIEEHPFSCVRAEHVGRGLRALEMLDKDGPCAAVRFVCAPSQPARAVTLGQHGQVQHGRRCNCACARGPSHLHSEPGRAAAAGGGPRSLSMQRCTLWNAAVTARPELLSRPRCGST